jgi:hypothetical protein
MFVSEIHQNFSRKKSARYSHFQSQQSRPRVSEIFYCVSGIINYDFFDYLGVFRFPKSVVKIMNVK